MRSSFCVRFPDIMCFFLETRGQKKGEKITSLNLKEKQKRVFFKKMTIVDRGILKRIFTISVVIPTIVFLFTYPNAIAVLVFCLTFLNMLEWTAVKRHLKVSLLLNQCSFRNACVSPTKKGSNTPSRPTVVREVVDWGKKTAVYTEKTGVYTENKKSVERLDKKPQRTTKGGRRTVTETSPLVVPVSKPVRKIEFDDEVLDDEKRQPCATTFSSRRRGNKRGEPEESDSTTKKTTTTNTTKIPPDSADTVRGYSTSSSSRASFQSGASSTWTYEFPTPAAKTNLFIVTKCFACSSVSLLAVYGSDWFHCGTTCYFLFWVLFTLVGQNKLETSSELARRKVGKSPVLTATENNVQEFHQMELKVIAENGNTDLFLSFCLEYFGFIWIMGLSYGLMMYHMHETVGPLMCFTVLVSNWGNDIAALVVGKGLKGSTRALYPRISPNKSVEGAVAGVVANGFGAAVIISLYGWNFDFMSPFNLNLSHEAEHVVVALVSFGLGIVLGVLGVLGDLLESLFKRTAMVKDTGSVFPGHGGVLDRTDGLLIVYPAAYWITFAFLKIRDGKQLVTFL